MILSRSLNSVEVERFDDLADRIIDCLHNGGFVVVDWFGPPARLDGLAYPRPSTTGLI